MVARFIELQDTLPAKHTKKKKAMRGDSGDVADTATDSLDRELQHFPPLLKQSGGTVHASLCAEFKPHTNLVPEEIKSRFYNIDEYLSKESWGMDPYIIYH